MHQELVECQPEILSLEDLNLEGFLNKHGEVRLENVRGCFDLNAPEDREKVCALWKHFVQDDDFYGLRREETLELNDEIKTITTTYWLKACKRGNDIDMHRTEARVKNVGINVLPYVDHSWNCDYTRALKLTLTVDPTVFNHDILQAWLSIGKEWNRFISVLRKRYGKVEFIRSWEAHESGMPHVHAELCFKEKRWLVIMDKSNVPRIMYEEKLELQDAWRLGFVDVQATIRGSLSEDIEDIIWYIVKSKQEGDYKNIETWSKKRILTLAILWYLGKRGWSVSKGLNWRPNADLTSAPEVIQTDLSGIAMKSIVKWSFIGMIKHRDTDIETDVWCKIYADPPDWEEKAWLPKRMRRRKSTLQDMFGKRD